MIAAVVGWCVGLLNGPSSQANVAMIPEDSPKSERERHVHGACGVYGACSILSQWSSASRQRMVSGRWGLHPRDIALYVDVIRHHVADGDGRSRLTFEVVVPTDQGKYAGSGESFTGADAAACQWELMDYVRRFPTPLVTSGKEVPMLTILCEAKKSCSPDDIEWYRSWNAECDRQ
jgi:hypothetical protein